MLMLFWSGSSSEYGLRQFSVACRGPKPPRTTLVKTGGHGDWLICSERIAIIPPPLPVFVMLDQVLNSLTDFSLVLFGALVAAALFVSNEIGYRIGMHRAQRRPAGEQEHIGIGTITAGMLGLLAFTLSLTINIAQNRYEARRSLVLQEANSVQTAWLRSKLIGGERGPPITAMIEEFAKVQLAYVSTNRFEDEAGLIARKTALEAQIWHAMQVLSHEQPTTTSGLALALTEMFSAARAERFAFASQVPADLTWMLMGGSMLAIGALGYHLRASGSRHIVLTSLLLVMWAGGIVLIADLNRPRIGAIRVDPAPLRWTVEDFSAL
ncbi:hypothetical protein [Acidisphaera sp. S103]|uniref:bestrophin-like domain n=1 Tax=Acidisphaera sp. S103 TaxID=1747223 RepID=UPI00131E0C47|nr:hypothetical protein [Acidisphaera sp. S103]